MKKSTIWLLTVVMACTITGLLFVQIMYMENMIKMRNEQFNETVQRSLYAVASLLEQDETRYYLEQDINESEMGAANLGSQTQIGTFPVSDADDLGGSSSQQSAGSSEGDFDFDGQYQKRQDLLRGQYLYQRGLLNEVILSILNQASDRPIAERADSATVSSYIKRQLESNGLKLPFGYAVVSPIGGTVYKLLSLIHI